MNEFQAWDKILLEWKQVNRMKGLNQQLYDQLGGTLIYILDYRDSSEGEEHLVSFLCLLVSDY